MSMISSQRDTLLVMADALEEEYPSFAREVRRAADTIWELRNKLAGVVDQRERIAELEDENAKLRKAMDFQALELGCMTDNRDILHLENEKLRELVRYMHRCYVSGHDWGPWGAPEKQHVEDVMRELRIEVD